jgi:hypothetical protein
VVKDYSLRDDFIGLDDDIFRKFVGSADGKTIGSANYRIIMRYTAGTTYGIGSDIAIYKNY